GDGTASANAATGMAGKTVTLTATPGDGYKFIGWLVITGGAIITDSTFTMPAEAVTVRAVFEPFIGSNINVDAGSLAELPYILTWNAWSHPNILQSHWYLDSPFPLITKEVVYVFDFPDGTTEASLLMNTYGYGTGTLIAEASEDLITWHTLPASGGGYVLDSFINGNNIVFVRFSETGIAAEWKGLLSWTLSYDSLDDMNNANADRPWLGSRANSPNGTQTADIRNDVVRNTFEDAFIYRRSDVISSQPPTDYGFWHIYGDGYIIYEFTLASGSSMAVFYANMANRFRVEYASSPTGPWLAAAGAVGTSNGLNNHISYSHTLDVSSFSNAADDFKLYVRVVGNGGEASLRSWGIYNPTGGLIAPVLGGEHTITVEPSFGGTAEALQYTAKAGQAVFLEATPERGFRLEGWEILYGSITIIADAFFIMPNRDVAVRAIFERGAIHIQAGSEEELPYLFTWNAWSHEAIERSNWFMESSPAFNREVVYVFDFPGDATSAAFYAELFENAESNSKLRVEVSTNLRTWHLVEPIGDSYELDKFLAEAGNNVLFVRCSDADGWIGLLSWSLYHNSRREMRNLRDSRRWTGMRANAPRPTYEADKGNVALLNSKEEDYLFRNGGVPEGRFGYWNIPNGSSITYRHMITAGSTDILLYANMVNSFKVEFSHSPDGPWLTPPGVMGTVENHTNAGSYVYGLDVSSFSNRHREFPLYVRFSGNNGGMILRSWGIFNATGTSMTDETAVVIEAGSREEIPFLLTWSAWCHPAIEQSHWFLESNAHFKREVVYVFDFPDDVTKASFDMTLFPGAGRLKLEVSADLVNWHEIESEDNKFQLDRFLANNEHNLLFVRCSDADGWIGMLSWILVYNSAEPMNNLTGENAWRGSRANAPNPTEPADVRNAAVLGIREADSIYWNGGYHDAGGHYGHWWIPNGGFTIYQFPLPAGSVGVT
ncbi:MAG: hypothetical protein FWE68_06190, partial [Defluviitaleaceae bacterium]|nr:hypothetical protein [Defluviitaleaceae bacterium]